MITKSIQLKKNPTKLIKLGQPRLPQQTASYVNSTKIKNKNK
jgi:hypothetical protein